MPRQEQINIYKFNELDDFSKDKVREHFRKWFPPEDWHDFLLSSWKERLEKIGFNDVDIKYTGFFSQGDGASFTGKLDVTIFLDKTNSTETGISNIIGQRLIKLINNNKLDICVEVWRIASLYSHENTVGVHLNSSIFTRDTSNRVYPNLALFIESMETFIIKFVRNTSRKIYKELQEEYEVLNSFETLDNFIIQTDSDYLSNGTVINLKK